MSQPLTHLTADGEAHMVDIIHKPVTSREAVALARIPVQQDILDLVKQASHKKGDVLATARIAGIMAAKNTSQLIPLCHPLALTKVQVDIALVPATEQAPAAFKILARCAVEGKTGVEMEAMTAASVAALTLYDMCKAVDPTLVIQEVKLLEKTGGKSGHWVR